MTPTSPTMWNEKTRVRKTFNKLDDEKLMQIVMSANKVDWTEVANQMGNRTPRQCRERWKNYVDPKLLKDQWSVDEDERLLKKFDEIGSHWTKLKNYFPGRSVNSLKNRYSFLTGKKGIKQTSSEDGQAEKSNYIEFFKISNLLNKKE